MFDTLFRAQSDLTTEMKKRLSLRYALLKIVLSHDGAEAMRALAKDALTSDEPDWHDFSQGSAK